MAHSLPREVGDLTPAWLTETLRAEGRDVEVTSLSVGDIIWGTATKVFVTAEYQGRDADALATTLCIKGGFDEQSREFGLAPAYEIEANFFADVAPELDIPLPRVLSSRVEPGQGVIVMEDLRPAGTTFGNPTKPLSADEVAKALEIQARWHAQTWGAKAPRRDWLQVGCTGARGALDVLLGEQMFGPLSSRELVPTLPAALAGAEQVHSAYRKLWAKDDADALALSHGDAHVGQTYTVPGSGPAFLDWQGACLAPWSCDVTYFIGGALDIDERRTHERDLLDHYRRALVASGGPDLDPGEAWTAYREHTLHGFIWVVTPTHLQSEEIVAVMAERYVAAIADHDPLSLL